MAIEWRRTGPNSPPRVDPEDFTTPSGKYLFIWDHEIFTGWPLSSAEGDYPDDNSVWEESEGAAFRALGGVEWWAPFPELPR